MRLNIGGITMAELITKYTDAKNNIHSVQHVTLPDEKKPEKQQLTEELYRVLSQKFKFTVIK